MSQRCVNVVRLALPCNESFLTEPKGFAWTPVKIFGSTFFPLSIALRNRCAGIILLRVLCDCTIQLFLCCTRVCNVEAKMAALLYKTGNLLRVEIKLVLN